MDLGKKAEKFIIDYLKDRDKKTYAVRFVDTYDANKGRWGVPGQKKVIVEKRPCDAMLVVDGVTYFCEVKATSDRVGINSGLFSTQKGARLRITNAGGNFLYLIYSYTQEKWYWVPYADLNPNASWGELEKFSIDFPKVPN